MTLEGLRSYDPVRKVRLQTHLYNHLQGLKRVNRQETQGVSVPERIVLERRYLDSNHSDLTEELGREPTDSELMDRTGLSAKRLTRLRQYQRAIPEGSMADPISGAEYGGSVRSAQQQHTPWTQLVYDDLDPHHQKVMEFSLGLHGHPVLPNHEIARRLGKSAGAISQAKLRIQRRLDEEQELSPFGGDS
jgi:DNA-directed RNA polymerase specialized sigma subunit